MLKIVHYYVTEFNSSCIAKQTWFLTDWGFSIFPEISANIQECITKKMGHCFDEMLT